MIITLVEQDPWLVVVQTLSDLGWDTRILSATQRSTDGTIRFQVANDTQKLSVSVVSRTGVESLPSSIDLQNERD